MDNENKYKYLGIIERALDPAQSNVCFTTENAVIAAGAGSGKTQVLATRFAWLVISKDVKASEILTLTFTDKAASEMYQRIYATLKYFAEYKPKTDEELLEFFKTKRRIENPTAQQLADFREAEKDLTIVKQQKAREALLDFTNAHIQTLDSYCGSIVRQCANRYGITPAFSVGSGDGTKDIKDMAFRFALKNINASAFLEFSKPGRIKEFASGVFADTVINHTSVATPDGYFSKKFINQKKAFALCWNKRFAENRTDSFFSQIFDIEAAIESDPAAGTPAKQLWAARVRDCISYARALVDSITPIDESHFENDMERIQKQVQQLEKFFDLLDTVRGTKGAINAIKSQLKALNDNVRPDLCYISYFVRTYSLQKQMMQLMDSFLKEVNQKKRNTGALTFSDVTELALKILLENEDIRNNEKNAYKKIMIDEFQDNNSKNRDLLYLLSLKPGAFESKNGGCVIEIDDSNPESLHNQIVDQRDSEKLFFVGDEKQSIYKFRDADVSVFNKLTKENKKVAMSYNYRSTPELINAFNIFFKNENGIFVSQYGNDEDDFEAHYTENAAKNGMDELPLLTAENVPIHFRFINEILMEEDEAKAPFYIPKKEQLAYDIAKSIRERAEKMFKGIPEEQWQWSKFAILDKSRSSRDEITKYLSLFNIPFQVDQFTNIFQEGVINDIYNFLRSCVYSSDIKAFAVYLTSPFCGLSENSAETVLSHLIDTKFRSDDEEPFVFNPVDLSKDEEIKKDLPAKDYEKFVSARNFYAEYKKTALQQELTSTLTTLWHQLGYKYETMLTSHSKLCAEHFDMLFELARNCDENGKNASWFIDELEELKAQFGSDSEIDAGGVKYPLERSQAVQIMTIHKSKGLQFDYVYLWGCTNIKSKSDFAPYYYEEETGVSLKPMDGSGNYFQALAKEEESLKELAEFRRLVYVGITRAVKDVVITGRIDVRDGSLKSFRLISDMITKLYPEFETDKEFALGKTVFTEGSAFDYHSIVPVTYDQLPKQVQDTDAVRAEIIRNAKKAEEEQFVDATCRGIQKKSPSKINEEIAPVNDHLYKSEKKDMFVRLTEIIKKYDKNPEDTEEIPDSDDKENLLFSGEFAANDFGTLVHDYLCRMAQGIDINSYIPEPEKKYFKNLSESDRLEIISICIKMCTIFAKTPLYKAFCDAKSHGLFAEPEYEFKYYSDKTLYRGSIDLIFENSDGSYTIVDYKTDSGVRPYEHYNQQRCYKEAAKNLVPHDGKISCCLYYLRFDEIVYLPL